MRFAAADVRDEDQVQAAVAAAAQLGTLRVAVNCAGVATPGRVISKRGVLPLETFRTVIDINLVGTFNVLRLAAAAMIENEPLDGDRGCGDHDRQCRRLRWSDRPGSVRGEQGRHRRFDIERGKRPCRQGDPGHDHRARCHGDPDDGRSSRGDEVDLGGLGAASASRLGRPEEYAMLVSSIIKNPLLNGEVIRLDGALRMPPR